MAGIFPERASLLSSRTLKALFAIIVEIRNYLSRDNYLNRRARAAASRLQLPPLVYGESSTSVSDYPKYRQIVSAAAQDDLVFNFFRSHESYLRILEHVSKSQGAKYLDLINRRSNAPRDWSQKSRALSLIGSPQRHTYGEIGRISPTVLRYVKVYTDLEFLFGPLRGLRYAEIGIGFGGQAAVLRTLGQIGELELYDLPPVLALAKKFLESCDIDSSLSLRDGTVVPPAQHIDLLVSNYAFSELTRDLQLRYLENVITKAPMGYITWNSLSEDGLSPDELLGLIPGSRILKEEPKTHRDNLILTWGSDRVL